jgi:hypothetical protein
MEPKGLLLHSQVPATVAQLVLTSDWLDVCELIRHEAR